MNRLANKARRCIGEDMLSIEEELNSHLGSSTNWWCDL